MIGHGLYRFKTTHQNVTNWQIDQETINQKINCCITKDGHGDDLAFISPGIDWLARGFHPSTPAK